MTDNSRPSLISALGDQWVVVNKPPGWLTIAPSHSMTQEQANLVLKLWLEHELGKPVYTVHRLDRETSGAVLFALSQQSHREACEWFMKRTAKKIYYALAHGVPSLPVMRVDTAIAGASAISQFEVVAKSPVASVFLTKVRLHTGRRHQIRIHLSGQGFPLLADSQYGGASQVHGLVESPIKRVALHSRSLTIPSYSEQTAPWPTDFLQALDALSIRVPE